MATRSPEAVKLLLSSFLHGNTDQVSTQTISDDLSHDHNVQETDSGRPREDRSLSRPTHPTDRQAFYTRISTFNSRTWFAKPLWLSPPYCARYGWCNIDRDLLRCVSCKAFLSGKMPSCADPQVYALCCDRLLSSLQTSHNILCPWSSYPSPESFLTPHLGSQSVALCDAQERFTNLLALGDKLPLLMLEVISSLNLSIDELERLTTLLRQTHNLTKNSHSHEREDSGSELSFHTAVDPDDLQNSRDGYTSLLWQRSTSSETEPQHITHDQVAALIAICGWSRRDGNIPQLHCSLCDRRVGLWCYHSYHSHAQPEQEEDEADEEPDITPDEPSGGELHPQPPSEELQQDQACGEIEVSREKAQQSTLGEGSPGESEPTGLGDVSSEHKAMEDRDLMDPGEENIHTEIVDELLTEQLQQDSQCHDLEGAQMDCLHEDSESGDEIDCTETHNSSDSSEGGHVDQDNQNDDIIFYVDNLTESSSPEELESCTLSCDDQLDSDSESKNLIQEVVSKMVNYVVTECNEDILTETEATQSVAEEMITSDTSSEKLNDSLVGGSEEIAGLSDSEHMESAEDVPQLDGARDDMSENKAPAVGEESLHSSDGSSQGDSDHEEVNMELTPIHQEEVIQHDASFEQTSSPTVTPYGVTAMHFSCSDDNEENSSNLASSDDDVCVVLDSDDEPPPSHEPDIVCASDVNFVPVEDSDDSCYDIDNDSDDEGSYQDESETYEDSLTPFAREDQDDMPHTVGQVEEELAVDMDSSDVPYTVGQEEEEEVIVDMDSSDEEDWASEQSDNAACDPDALAGIEQEAQNVCDVDEHTHLANQTSTGVTGFSEVDIEADVAVIMDSECVQTMNPETGALSDTLDSDIFDPEPGFPETEFVSDINLNIGDIPSQTVSDTSATYHSQPPDTPQVSGDVEHSDTVDDVLVDDQQELHVQEEAAEADKICFKITEDHAMGDSQTTLDSPQGQVKDMVTGDGDHVELPEEDHNVGVSSDASIDNHSGKDSGRVGDSSGDVADRGCQDFSGSKENEANKECSKGEQNLPGENNLPEDKIEGMQDVDSNAVEDEVQDVEMEGDRRKQGKWAEDLLVDEQLHQGSKDKCALDDPSLSAASEQLFGENVELREQASGQDGSECHQQELSDAPAEPLPESEDITLKRKHSDDDFPTDATTPADVHVQPQRKKRKPKVILNSFCPVSEHRSWCPWVARTTCTSSRSDGGCPRITPGWRKLLELLLTSNLITDSIMVQMAKITPPHNNLRSIRHILDQWTSQSTCVDQTTL